MGYKCSFLDNEIYGADDVSAAFSRLTTEGILPYPTTEQSVAASLNELNAQLATEGVADFGGCEVSFSDGIVRIGEGTAFFKSGVAIVVDSDGITLDHSAGTQAYVSFIYENELNRAAAQITTELPQGDCVLLARIDESGNVIDMRRYARSKLKPNGANMIEDFVVVVPRGHGKEMDSYFDDEWSAHYELAHCDYKYLLLHKSEQESNNSFTRTDIECQIVDISEEGVHYIELARSSISNRLYIRRVGTELSFYCTNTDTRPVHNYLSAV